MQKICRIGLFGVFLSVIPAHAAIGVFKTSLPAQAGVNSVFIYDTWDYIVTPAFYSLQKVDAVSAVYTPDQYDNKTFVLGGRNTIGIPLYWAVGIKNERTKAQNYDAASQSTFDNEEGEAHYRLTLGTNFGTLGVGVFGEYLDAAIVRNNTSDGTLYSAGSETKDLTSNRYRVGVNVGQSTLAGHTWSLGVGVRQNGGDFRQVGAGSINVGTLPATLTAGALRRPQNALYLDVNTFGWIKLTERGERAYWRGNFSHQLKADIAVSRLTGVIEQTAKLDEDDNQGELFVGYAMAWPLSDVARFYFGPEVGATYSEIQTYATNGANGFSGGVLGFTGNNQRLQESTRVLSGRFNLPIVFQVPVVLNVLTLQAGWYPEIIVYGETARQQTDSFATPAKRLDAKSSRIFQANVERYGGGVTYNPVERLKIHLLVTSIKNSAPLATNYQADAYRISFGVDYVFAPRVAESIVTPAVQSPASPAAAVQTKVEKAPQPPKAAAKKRR